VAETYVGYAAHAATRARAAQDLRASGCRIKHLGEYSIRPGESLEFAEERVAVQTYRDYFEEYRLHREAKALGPDRRPRQRWTRGLLQPPRVSATELVRVGKESNPLADGLDFAEADDARVIVHRERQCLACGTPLTGQQRKWCGEACRKRIERTFVHPSDDSGSTRQ
jgi:hypothetical protein